MGFTNICLISSEAENELSKRISRIIPESELTSISKNTGFLLQEMNFEKFSVLIISDDLINQQRKDFNEMLQSVLVKNPLLKIILLVKDKNIPAAVESLQNGVYHYIKLPVTDEELKLVIESAIEQKTGIIDENIVEKKNRKKFGEITGSSSEMQKVYEQILQAAETDIPVLILGETGTGKDLLAYTIHKMSLRHEEPYLAVNLGALPSELVASELFGHEKGAFTGALRQHKGVFEQGDKGTVFLDEIDTMDEKVQVSLLRLLEQKKFKRLGGTNLINSEARLIAATNENIDDLAATDIFRPDLFYRLDVFRITLPPLRERKSDIPLLVDEMVIKYSRTFKKTINSVSGDAIEALMNFDWPGNVRELKNAIQRAVLVCNNGELNIEHLPPRFNQNSQLPLSVSFDLGTPLDEVEREMVKHALAYVNNNRTEAAKLLGISRRALYNKLDKHNL